MKLVVVANEVLEKAFLLKPMPPGADICFVKSPEAIPADAYIVFDLLFEHNAERIAQLKNFLPRPVFINAVADTLASIQQPFIRINAWPTFLERDLAEVVVLPPQENILQQALTELGWHYCIVPDVAGMVSARIVAMLINEAYFTLDENVSTPEEIDIAMKTGTNYPYGPFEWCRLTGLANIYALLVELNKEDPLYQLSPALIKEVVAPPH